MDKPSFVYTTYIRTTPEQLWQALTEPAFTRHYWNASFQTDWKAGCPMVWDPGGDLEQLAPMLAASRSSFQDH